MDDMHPYDLGRLRRSSFFAPSLRDLKSAAEHMEGLAGMYSKADYPEIYRSAESLRRRYESEKYIRHNSLKR